MKKRIGMLIVAMSIFMASMMVFADYETPRPKKIAEPEIVVEKTLEGHQ